MTIVRFFVSFRFPPGKKRDGREKEVDQFLTALRSVCPAQITSASFSHKYNTLSRHKQEDEAASFLGIAKSTLYKMTHENRIPFNKPAGKPGDKDTW